MYRPGFYICTYIYIYIYIYVYIYLYVYIYIVIVISLLVILCSQALSSILVFGDRVILFVCVFYFT